MNDAPEGWRVPQRPAFIAAVLVPLVLLAALLLAGRLYTVRLRPAHRQPVTTFPAPGVETFIHDGGHDPHRPLPRPTVDAALETAKHRVVAEGLGAWPAPR